MNTLDALDAESLRSDIPYFRPGDTLKVHVRVIEGNRSATRCSKAWSSAARRWCPRDLHMRKVPSVWRADVPGALAEHRQDRGCQAHDVRRAKRTPPRSAARPPRSGASRDALCVLSNQAGYRNLTTWWSQCPRTLRKTSRVAPTTRMTRRRFRTPPHPSRAIRLLPERGSLLTQRCPKPPERPRALRSRRRRRSRPSSVPSGKSCRSSSRRAVLAFHPAVRRPGVHDPVGLDAADAARLSRVHPGPDPRRQDHLPFHRSESGGRRGLPRARSVGGGRSPDELVQ